MKALAWQGVKNATSHGQPCPQPGVTSHSSDPEDCLSLDVYTPTVTFCTFKFNLQFFAFTLNYYKKLKRKTKYISIVTKMNCQETFRNN